MWWRALIGLVAVCVGAIWIGQGAGAVHGSFMTGHSQYTAYGAVLGAFGLIMITWAVRVRGRVVRREEA